MTGLELVLFGVGVDLARRWLSGRSRLPELNMQAMHKSDDFGCGLLLRFGERFSNETVIAIHVLGPGGAYLKGHPDFSDEDGDFVTIRPVVGGTCALYVPFGALGYCDRGEYQVRVTALQREHESKQLTPVGSSTFDIDLPESLEPWTKIEHLRPLLELAMTVAHADGELNRTEVRFIRALFEERLKVPADEHDGMRRAMKRRAEPVAELAESIAMRLPDLSEVAVIEMLAEVAKCDGPITEEEIQVIQEYAICVELPEEVWNSLSEELELSAIDHWAVLELAPGRGPDEIKAAFRRLLKEYHPDHFERLPKAFRDMATAKTIELKRAYDALMARFRTSA